MVDDTVGWATLVSRPAYQHLIGRVQRPLATEQRYTWALAVAKSFQARPPNRRVRK